MKLPIVEQWGIFGNYFLFSASPFEGKVPLIVEYE